MTIFDKMLPDENNSRVERIKINVFKISDNYQQGKHKWFAEIISSEITSIKDA